MENIFGKNKYRFGVESFLLMYLKKYQFVLGYDLEVYGKRNETFTKDSPCNIYFVLRRPKVTINPNSVKIKDKKADFELIVKHPTEGGIINMGIELKEAKSMLEFHS